MTLYSTTYVCVPGTLCAIVNPHYFIHCKPYIRGRDSTISFLQTTMKNMDRLIQWPLVEWQSWNTLRKVITTAVIICALNEMKKKVSVLGIIILFSQSSLRSKTFKDTNISNSVPQRGKTHFGGITGI